MLDDAVLTVRQLGADVRTVSLTGDKLAIGRLPDNDLVFPERTVSSHHALLRRESGGYTVTDLDSLNHTYVGDEQLRPYQPRLLSPGDSIRIVTYELVYGAPRTAAPGADAEPQVPSGADRAEAAEQADRTPSSEGASPPRVPPRPTYPMPLPDGPSSRYLRYLPGLYHEDDFIGRFLLIMEAIWEPLEQREDHIELYANPKTCPASFLGWLGGWLGVALEAHWPEARCRRLLTEAMDLYRWRGTRYGLTRMIEVCTGLAPEVDEGMVAAGPTRSQPHVFHVRVTIPPDSDVDREFIDALVRAHKPAHAGYVLDVRPAREEAQ